MTSNQAEHSTEIFKDYPNITTISDPQAMLNIGGNTTYKVLQNNSIVSIRAGKQYIIPKNKCNGIYHRGDAKMKYHISISYATILSDMIGCSKGRRA